MRLRNPVATLVMAVVLISFAGWIRGSVFPPDGGMPIVQFNAVKYSHVGDSDIVLAGCSRVMMGLSPETMCRVIPRARVTNFGFEGSGYERRYLDAIASVLDQKQGQKIIVLGIAPHQFCRSHVESNKFIELNSEKQMMVHLSRYRWIGLCVQFTRPFGLDEIKSIALGQHLATARSLWTYHKSGWVECEKYPESDAAIAEYKRLYSSERVSDGIIVELMDRVRLWRSDGIRVYALRLPTSREMRELENKRSGVEEAGFVRRFSEAGGKWIPVDMKGYHSYDGSHLQAKSAVKLSKLVGERIRRDLADEK